MAEFLFEIGLEEVPARMIASAQAELLRRTIAVLNKQALLSPDFDPLTDAQSYSTPRRLAVQVRGVLERQNDISEDVVGPAVKIAYKEGVPTPAAEAFARKNGVAVDDLRTVQTPKGEYLAVTSLKKGRSAAEVIADFVPSELDAIYWAKSMYWRPGKPERFVRPVLWMVCLLDEQVVPVQFAGCTAGRASSGHRVLSSGEAFEVQTPSSYLAQLEGEYVLADVEARRHRIRKALDHATRRIADAQWREDEALVDSVTHLTEWPDVLLGSFDREYLALPEEVLVTVMRDHQKYFAVEDADGKLAPYFLAVVNIALNAENEAIIRQGNERVLRARFNDARFFWEFDQRTPLVERLALLENVTFQKELGSYAAKSIRVRAIAAKLAQIMSNIDADAILDAASLAKADLTTELVKEFTELQGIIGGLYAKSQGIRETVADAIYDQYLPAGMDDGVPRSLEGAVLGLADRADTIAGMFGLGMEPTGSKDPFALRRAANGIVKILAETAVDMNLDAVIHAAASEGAITDKLRTFFKERLEFYLRDVKGFAYDVVAAVLAVENNTATFNNVRDAIARAEAITVVRGGADFAAVSAAFKRMKNILLQADFGISNAGSFVSVGIPAEDALWSKFKHVDTEITQAARLRAYGDALQAIASLRPEVDAFFDAVMVNDPDPDVRRRRLTLLSTMVDSVAWIADFSEIVVAG